MGDLVCFISLILAATGWNLGSAASDESSLPQGTRRNTGKVTRCIAPSLGLLFWLRERCDLAVRCAQIVGGRNQNLQTSDARRDRYHVEQFDGFVDVQGEAAFSCERGHSAANVAGERLQFFYRDELNL